MRKAKVYMDGEFAGIFKEENESSYTFIYDPAYQGPPVSLTIPLAKQEYTFSRFPSFFEGLLPEGIQLEGLLRQSKIDSTDYFAQLIATGQDLVGAITLEALEYE